MATVTLSKTELKRGPVMCFLAFFLCADPKRVDGNWGAWLAEGVRRKP